MSRKGEAMYLRRWVLCFSVVIVCLLSACANGTSTTSAPGATGTKNSCVAVDPASGLRAFSLLKNHSQASYQASEQALGQDLPEIIIGKTHEVSGEFLLTSAKKPEIRVLKILVDLSTLSSDQSERDDHLRKDVLNSVTYPYALFVAKDVQVSQNNYTEGQDTTFKLKGDLTIHNITHPATFDMHGKLVGDTITGTATGVINMQDYGVEPPGIAGVVTVQNSVMLTLNFVAKQVSCSQLGS